jgi:hypothetical protein
VTPSPRTGRPRFTGVSTYQDPLGRFSFRHPGDWNAFELADDREGVMYSPESVEFPQTYFAVWISKLDEHVVAEDQAVLQEGVDAGLAQLSNCEVESAKNDVLSNLVKLERIYTFDDEGVTRKRRVWTMYVDTWLIVAVWQGSSPEEYAYWLPMGNYAFATFELPQALWFATDRDLRAFG